MCMQVFGLQHWHKKASTMSNMQGNVGSVGRSQLGSLFPMPWRLLVAVLASVKGEPCDGAVKSFEPKKGKRRK